MKSFRELTLPESLHSALQALSFETPTPVQAQSIPLILEGRDLIACAQTGTGKTAAFGLPMIVHLLKDPQATALVLTPTRELATQVHDVIQQLARFAPEMKSSLLIGGTSMMPQLRSLKKKPRVIIATPGRLLDHLQQKSASLNNTRFLVLDEADRMLDMGFAPQLRQILRFVPEKRQTLLFSATIPPDIQHLAEQQLKNPARVSVATVSSAAPAIEQQVRRVDPNSKNPALLEELNQRAGSAIVFARTQVRTDRVTRYLEGAGVSVAKIHGGRSQGQRKRALDAFRSGEVRVLVATDIAARGLDISHVAHVINYDLPQVAEDYVHRIGRTGRAGKSGEAISFVTPDDAMDWTIIQRLLSGKVDASSASTHQPRPGQASSSQRSGQQQRSSRGQQQSRSRGRSQNRRDDSRRGPRQDSRGGSRQDSRQDSRGGARSASSGRGGHQRNERSAEGGARSGQRDARPQGAARAHKPAQKSAGAQGSHSRKTEAPSKGGFFSRFKKKRRDESSQGQ